MMRFVFFFILFFISFSSPAQLIVNIENKRMQSDTTGWMGSMGASFSLTRNVQEIIGINANAHVQYKTLKNLYLLVASYTLLKRNEEDLNHNMFYHLRYNRKLSKWLRWEAFTQWQQNSVTNIALRILNGTGLRFKLHESPKLKLYAGTTAMYEYEKEKVKPPVFHNDMRSSNYLSVTYQPHPVIEIISTTFYQPLFRQISDFRILNQATVNIKATERFSVSIGWDYLYDAFPASETPRVNYSLNNGVHYAF